VEARHKGGHDAERVATNSRPGRRPHAAHLDTGAAAHRGRGRRGDGAELCSEPNGGDADPRAVAVGRGRGRGRAAGCGVG